MLETARKNREVEIDTNFTQEHLRSGLEKIEIVAAKYDKNHPSSVSLDGFQGASMTPGIFREMLKRTFNIRLSPKELGAVMGFIIEFLMQHYFHPLFFLTIVSLILTILGILILPSSSSTSSNVGLKPRIPRRLLSSRRLGRRKGRRGKLMRGSFVCKKARRGPSFSLERVIAYLLWKS